MKKPIEFACDTSHLPKPAVEIPMEWGTPDNPTPAGMISIAVCDYETGDRLAGSASPELIAASRAEEGPTGAVAAFRDVYGTWVYVPDVAAADKERMRGVDVRTVFVEES